MLFLLVPLHLSAQNSLGILELLFLICRKLFNTTFSLDPFQVLAALSLLPQLRHLHLTGNPLSLLKR